LPGSKQCSFLHTVKLGSNGCQSPEKQKVEVRLILK